MRAVVLGLFVVAVLAGPGLPGQARAEEPPAPQPQRLDLPTALTYALDHNRALTRSALGLRGSALNVPAAEAAFGLNLRPDGNVGSSQSEDVYQYGLISSKKFLPGTVVEVGGHITHAQEDTGEDSRRTSMRVDLRQPLFRNFGALVQGESIVQAEQQLRTARRAYEAQKTDLAVNVVESFENLIRLGRLILSDEASFQRMDKLYRLTKAREHQGRATRVDTLRVELQRGQAQSRLENSRERLYFSQRDFAELLGLAPDTTFELEPPPLLDMDIPANEVALRIALSNRLDYAQALQDRVDRARGVKLARRDLLPDLSLNARYENVSDSRFDHTDSFDEHLWFVGLSGITDLNQSRERAQLGQAVLSQEASEETIRIQELSIAREVQQQTSAYKRSLVDLKIAERNFTLAESRARLARRLFEIGHGDNFSVTDAEQALNEAEVAVLAARADASVSGYKLLRAMGTLLQYPDDLKPPIERAAL